MVYITSTFSVCYSGIPGSAGVNSDRGCHSCSGGHGRWGRGCHSSSGGHGRHGVEDVIAAQCSGGHGT